MAVLLFAARAANGVTSRAIEGGAYQYFNVTDPHTNHIANVNTDNRVLGLCDANLHRIHVLYLGANVGPDFRMRALPRPP